MTSTARRGLLERLEARRSAAITANTREPADARPTTVGQHHIWLFDELNPDTVFHRLPFVVDLDGPLDADALERALDTIFERHEVARALFVPDGDQLTYRTTAPRPTLRRVDLTGFPDDAHPDLLDAVRAAELRRPMPFGTGPLIQLTLIRLRADRHQLLVVMHHLVADGTSLLVLQRELPDCYADYAHGRTPTLPRLDFQFGDFAAWQRDQLADPETQGKLDYWVRTLAGLPEPAELPFARQALARARAAATVPLSIPSELIHAIQSEHRTAVTPFMIGLAGFAVLLHRRTGEHDLLVGVTAAGRNQPGTEHLLGFFVNLLPLRLRLPHDPAWPEVLDLVRTATLDGYANQDASFYQLLERESDETSEAIPELHILFGSPPPPEPPRLAAGVAFAFAERDSGEALYDLEVQLYERGGGLDGFLKYRTARFDRTDIEYLARELTEVLEEVRRSPGTAVSAEVPPPASQRAVPPISADRMIAERAPVPPGSPTEETVILVWQAVLGVPVDSVHDDFFDLGGRSLRATRVAWRLTTALGVPVPVRLVFEHPTVAALAAAIDRLRPETPRAEDNSTPAGPHKHELADLMPVSTAQQRMWLLSRLDQHSPAYHIPYRIDLTGQLDPAALHRALEALVARHESLRTTFVEVDGAPRQRIRPTHTVALALPIHDDPGGVRLPALAADEARRPFDLGAPPLIRAALVRTGDTAWVLLLTAHHIVCDGWSVGVLFEDLAEAYTACLDGRLPDFVPGPRYIDVALAQDQLAVPTRELLFGYWRTALADAPELLQLPTDRPRPPILTDDGDSLAFHWPRAVADRLAQRAKELDSTPFTLLLAAFFSLLHRYSRQSDLLLATPVAGRTVPSAERVVGLFVNTLALRANLLGDSTFRDLLAQLGDHTGDAFAHQQLPFDQLVEELRPARSLSHQPLTQVMFALDDPDMAAMPSMPGLDVHCDENPSGTAKFDVTLTLTLEADRVAGRWEYRTQLFDRSTWARAADHLETLLAAALDDPDRQVSDLPLLTAPQRTQLVEQWRAGRTSFEGPLLHQIIEAHADRTPDAPALEYRDQTLSYRELDVRANRLAHELHTAGIGPEVPVGICLPHSIDLVVAFLGVLKAGAVYLPLDPDLPAERLRSLIEDSGVGLVLVDANTAALADTMPATVMDIASIADQPGYRLAAQVLLDSAAYLIYTSGSTGRPKGVVTTHRALRSFAGSQQDLLGVGPDDTVLQFHAPGFDASICDFVTALGAGAALRLVPRSALQPGPELAKTIREFGITVLDTLPAALVPMRPDEVPSLRSLTVGAEPCPVEVADRWAPGRDFVNGYGPTETTVQVIAGRYLAGSDHVVPIGSPMLGVRAYVLDERLEPVPTGVPGELHVGGDCLARGYLGAPAVTAACFVPDPFTDRPGERMYRTGDLVRHRTDGRLEFLGRVDAQVKIRGYRIELGEVESALHRCAGIRRGVVVIREDNPGETRLVAYVVGTAMVEALRAELRERLPEPMVPSAFVFLDELPSTPNGKVDHRALPAPSQDRPRFETAFVSPDTRTERIVAAIWQDVLAIGVIGNHDNFFDLGGNSLLLAKAQARLTEALDRPIRAVDLFRYPTVHRLARFLTGGAGTEQSNDAGARANDRKRVMAERARRMTHTTTEGETA